MTLYEQVFSHEARTAAADAAKETTVYTLFPALQRVGALTSITHTPEQNGAVHVIGDEP